SPACFAGDYRACTCTGADRGYQKCRADGDDFEPCLCDGTTPGLDAGEDAGLPDASVDGAADASDGSARGFLEACNVSEDCASGRCERFPGKGRKCTTSCGDAGDGACPPPSIGCSAGICEPP